MANIDAGLVRGPQGPQGVKGDPFTYADFTESQIAELQRPATEAAVLADKATKDAQAAIAEVKATEAKLYPAAENILKGKVKDTFVHVDDAFPSTLLGIEIEGATEQVTTTGKNLFNYYKLAEVASKYYIVENDSLKVIASDDDDWNKVQASITLDAGTYYASANTKIEIRSANDNSTVIFGNGSFVLDKATELKVKVGFFLSSYPVVVKVQIEKGSTATAYEPYTGGKPSPSPEYPQDIKVIENPTLNVTGRNLLKVPFAYNYSTNPFIVGGLSYTRKDDTGSVLIKGKKNRNTFFNLDFSTDAKALRGKSIFCKLDIDPSIAILYCGFFLEDGTYSTIINSSSGKSVKVPKNATSFRVYLNTTTTEDIDVEVHPAIYVVDDEKLYYPYASQRYEFTLPAKHPYLAKLPDGTADKIIIDKDGNVKLVANVKKIVWNGTAGSIRSEESNLTYKRFIHKSKGIVKGGNNIGLLDRLTVGNSYSFDMQANASANNSGELYSNYQAAENSIDKYAEWLKGDVTGYMPTLKPEEYDLGKIDILAIPESVSNIWVDAEVTPNVTIEYTRDVNIVVANLESAIASIS